jgi:hypothetical protein
VQRFYRLVIGVGVSLLGLAGPSTSIELLFVKEAIAVSVLPPDTIGVRGDYFFTAAGPAVTGIPLSYPFPVDSSADYPCFIEVKDTRTAQAIAFGRQGQAIMFSVGVRTGDTTAVTVVYKQRVKKNSGRYILTTTGIWGRPLVDSRYSVSVPDTMTLTYVSYECDSVATAGNRLVYQFFKKKFMPDRDLAFVWTDPSAGLQNRKKDVAKTEGKK